MFKVSYGSHKVSDSPLRTVMQRIANTLKTDLIVTSGDRNYVPKGGSKNSLHLEKRAVDFHSRTKDLKKLDLKKLKELYDLIKEKADKIFDHDQAYELIIHGQYTGTGGPHLHIGRYFEGTKKPGLYLKEEGLTLGTKNVYSVTYRPFSNVMGVPTDGSLVRGDTVNSRILSSNVGISNSVGEGGVNKFADVTLVQKLLNIALKKLKESNLVFEHFAPLVEDGICGPKTKKAIVIFQRDVVKMKHPDGRIDPGGPTIYALYTVAYGSSTNIIANTNKLKNSPTIHQKNKKEDPTDLVNDPRIKAMLEVIARTEGTHNTFDKGYGRLVYGKVVKAPHNPEWIGKRSRPDDTKEVYVKDFSRHPEALVEVTSSLKSTACGRYQFLSTTWKGLDLPSFEPYWQDVGAVKLMQRRKAIEPLLRNERPTEDDLDEALSKLSYEWASLPSGKNGGGRYGQPAKTFKQVVELYYKFLGE